MVNCQLRGERAETETPTRRRGGEEKTLRNKVIAVTPRLRVSASDLFLY